MQKSLMALGLLAGLGACAKEKPVADITIEGNIKNIPDGKVYLADAHSWLRFDSTECKEGRFRFRLQPDSSFTPSQVSIHYTNKTTPADSTKGKEQFYKRLGYRMLTFYDHTKGADSLKYYHTSFFLERGDTKLRGDAQGDRVRVFGNQETGLMYRLDRAAFGWLGHSEGEKRGARIRFFKNKIKENSSSYYLLNELYTAKEQYSEPELRQILALFKPAVQASALGGKVRQYLVNRVDPDQPYPNLALVGANNQPGWLLDTGAKVNMLVFWASWCGPCRQEISQLKELYADYQRRGVHLVSVSIDEKPESWQKALSQEQMGWQQLLVGQQQVELVKQQFNSSAIPLVVLTNSRGRELKRFTGYYENNLMRYRTVLEEMLRD